MSIVIEVLLKQIIYDLVFEWYKEKDFNRTWSCPIKCGVKQINGNEYLVSVGFGPNYELVLNNEQIKKILQNGSSHLTTYLEVKHSSMETKEYCNRRFSPLHFFEIVTSGTAKSLLHEDKRVRELAKLVGRT